MLIKLTKMYAHCSIEKFVTSECSDMDNDLQRRLLEKSESEKAYSLTIGRKITNIKISGS